jgi:hypothetical protein
LTFGTSVAFAQSRKFDARNDHNKRKDMAPLMYETINPFTEELIESFGEHTNAELEAIIAKAADTYETTGVRDPWLSAKPSSRRRRRLCAASATSLQSSLRSSGDRDADDLEDYRGLFWRRPVMAGVFTAALLSLAGIPVTMGFLGKFYVLTAGANAAAWPLIIVLVLTSVAGLFYYLRVVVALYSASPERAQIPMPSRTGASILVLGLTILLIWFGVYPAPLLNLIRATTAGLNVAVPIRGVQEPAVSLDDSVLVSKSRVLSMSGLNSE